MPPVGIWETTRSGNSARASGLRPPASWASARRAGLDQTGLVGDHDQLGAIASRELHQQPADMCLRRRRADEQLVPDLLVRQATCDQSQNLDLALGQPLEVLARRPLAG